ncbi:MAG: J domain-containing protein, partial [Acidimicrobiia bacterium]
DTVVERTDIQRRFRRLLRVAHPDQGGTSRGAAERIAELREARELLLDSLETADAVPPTSVPAEEPTPA